MLKIMSHEKLNDVLAKLGYTSDKKDDDFNQGKKVFDNKGDFISHMTAGQCWDYLKENNLIEII